MCKKSVCITGMLFAIQAPTSFNKMQLYYYLIFYYSIYYAPKS